MKKITCVLGESSNRLMYIHDKVRGEMSPLVERRIKLAEPDDGDTVGATIEIIGYRGIPTDYPIGTKFDLTLTLHCPDN